MRASVAGEISGPPSPWAEAQVADEIGAEVLPRANGFRCRRGRLDYVEQVDQMAL